MSALFDVNLTHGLLQVVSQMSSSSAEMSHSQNSSQSSGVFNMPSLVFGQEVTPNPPSQVSSKVTVHGVDNADASDVESSRWTAILDSISELKDSLEEDHHIKEVGSGRMEMPIPDGPDLLLGGCKHTTKQDVLAAIPPRAIVDRLVSKCFSSVDIAPVILHSPTFLDEYERFWDDPPGTSIMWIGLLFGMMCLATLYQEITPHESGQQAYVQDELNTARQIWTYREKTSQCLIIGDYTKATPFAIEALLLYTQVECLRGDDAQNGLWVLLGIIVRLVLRMGYHRDASPFPGISPFQAEMRRRAWAVIFVMDAQVSGQLGLPRMIRTSQSNAREPRNLLDSDIRENMTELPTARPESVQTPVQYLMAKSKLIAAFGEISDLETLVQRPQYAEVLRLDGILQSAYDSIPQWLTMRPIAESIMDSPAVITQRICVVLIYHRAKCTLHQPYLFRARDDARFIYSRTACIEAALEILRIQQIFHQETQAGGRLQNDEGRISFLVKNDFLFASTILCADVDRTLADNLSTESRKKPAIGTPSEEVIKALSDAYSIWALSNDSSHKAQHAARILRTVLDRVQPMRTRKPMVSTPASTSTFASREDRNIQLTSTEQSSASNSPSAVNARLVSSNPTFVPNLPGNEFNAFPDFAGVDIELVSALNLQSAASLLLSRLRVKM